MIATGPARVVVTMRYHDAVKAIDWLCSAFGFEQHLVVQGPEGTVTHAELTYGNGMVMVGSARNDDLGRLVRPPADTGGICTQCAYVVVADADTHHARAVAAGAQIVYPLKSEDYGGRGYGCVDLEGHLWFFGSYDPWRV